MKKLTDAVLLREVRAEAGIKTLQELEHFLQAVDVNLDLFTALIDEYEFKTQDTFSELVSIDNHLQLFTYKKCDLKQYRIGSFGECVISNIGASSNGFCYINDLNR